MLNGKGGVRYVHWYQLSSKCSLSDPSPQEHTTKMGPQTVSLQLSLWEIRSWFRGFAVWSPQPTTSCKSVSEYIEGPLQTSVGHRFKSSFQDKNREKNHPLQVSIQGHLYNQNTDQLCVWPHALNSLNKLYESLKP